MQQVYEFLVNKLRFNREDVRLWKISVKDEVCASLCLHLCSPVSACVNVYICKCVCLQVCMTYNGVRYPFFASK